jgi:type II secretory ATPase GspE/PulE/Tfp pilus assembly ATPase PilB-like protein
MSNALALQQELAKLDPTDSSYATHFVEQLLNAAKLAEASDVHVQPERDGLDVRWRLDGVLQRIGVFSRGESTDVVSRLKVMAELLTYRTEVPQEGRIRERHGDIEMRVSTFPTLYGERGVVRLFAARKNFQYLAELGLPPEIETALQKAVAETSGALIISGPAGSGKTTTAYACLRQLVQSSEGGKAVVSLEDPIEVAVDGVAQSQVNMHAGFDLAVGLRSLMRQDPEAILVGEIRDREAAEIVFQASLTGHIIVTTFHAGSAASAVSRLLDMGIEPYLLRSGTLAILNQRLVRQLCDCAREVDSEERLLGLPLQKAREPVGCQHCRQTGYTGRLVVAEMLQVENAEVGRAILDRTDASHLQQLAVAAGMVTCWQRALGLAQQGRTSPSELRRVFGFGR